MLSGSGWYRDLWGGWRDNEDDGVGSVCVNCDFICCCLNCLWYA